MSNKLFLSAAAAGILALSTGGNALAGDNRYPAEKLHTVTMFSGNDPAKVELKISDAQRVMFHQSGTLKVTRDDGSTWTYRPTLTQRVNGKTKYLIPSFRILGKDRVAVSLYNADPSAPIILEGQNPNS
jgi:hypothetical protein